MAYTTEYCIPGNHRFFEEVYETTLHEVMHALGFSNSAMAYWINPDTGEGYG